MKIKTWLVSMSVAASMALFASTSSALAKPTGGASHQTTTTTKGKETHKAKSAKKNASAHTKHKSKSVSSTPKSKKS